MADTSPTAQTGTGMDKDTIATLAPALKTFYPAISEEYNKDLPAGMAPLRPQGLADDDYILHLAKTLTTQDTNATKRLIDALDTVAGAGGQGADASRGLQQKLMALRHYQQIRTSAVDAVDQNTGSIFGMTFGQLFTIAIPKLFKWIFSGFEGGFSGLKAMIAQEVGDRTKQTFAENLQKQSIDTIGDGWGKETVNMFNTTVDKKVASMADPGKATPDTPLDLSRVTMLGGAVVSETKPVAFAAGNKAEAVNAAKAHFELVTDNITKSITSLASLIPATPGVANPMDAVKPILDLARASLIKNGAAVVDEYVTNKKPMDEAFKLSVLQRSLTDVRNDLAKDPANEKSVRAVDGMLAKFAGAKSLAEITAAAKRDPDLPNGTGVLVDALAKGIGSPALSAIIAKGIGDARLVQQAEQQQREAPSTDGGFTGKQYRDTIVEGIRTTMQESINPRVIKKSLDDKLDGFLGTVTLSPGSSKRDQLAGIISSAANQSVEERFIKLMQDPKTKTLDIDSIKQNIKSDINAVLDNEIREGGSLSSWDRKPVSLPFSIGFGTPYKDMIKQGIAEQIDGTFDQKTIDSLNKSLQLATAAEAKESAARTNKQPNILVSANAPDGPNAPLNTPTKKPQQKTPPASGSPGVPKPKDPNANQTVP